MVEAAHRYPLQEFPFARTPEEEAYLRRVHDLTGTLWAFDAGEETLAALVNVWHQVMDRVTSELDDRS